MRQDINFDIPGKNAQIQMTVITFDADYQCSDAEDDHYPDQVMTLCEESEYFQMPVFR
jgi:hypothetical protein